MYSCPNDPCPQIYAERFGELGMRKLYAALIVVVLFSFFFGYVATHDSGNDNSNKQGTSPVSQDENKTGAKEGDPLKEQISTMTLQEKVGQMVMVGLDSFENNAHSQDLIENYQVGGFVFFEKNIKDAYQLRTLLHSLIETNAKVNKIPLFLSVDEEGGKISRMPDEFASIPSSGTIGQINNPALSFQVGNLIGDELQLLGFNMNFGPVLDINSNPQNPVIGDRAFGSESALVSKLGIETMKGLQAQNVISVVKHFPGHGDTSVDSHLGLPKVNHDLERLKSFELLPFAEAIDNDVDAIMTGHLLMSQIDPLNPASLSSTVINDLLREQMAYDSVVLTDDLTMGAISENFEMGEAAVKAIKAGNDIILVCHEYAKEKAALQALQKAVRQGDISEERIDESVYRILKLKQKYNLSESTDSLVEGKGLEVQIAEINQRIKKLFEGRYGE